MKQSRDFVLPDIRNAAGLDSEQKAFLYNLASHQGFEEFSARDLLMERTGLTDRKLRRTRQSLIELGLVKAVPRPGRTTLYKLQTAALKAYSKKAKAVSTVNTPARRAGQTTNVQGVQGTPEHSDHRKENSEVVTENISMTSRPGGISSGETKRRVRIVRRKRSTEPIGAGEGGDIDDLF